MGKQQEATDRLQDFADSQYERPNQPWTCGLAELGISCPLGPNQKGDCVTSALCEPVQENGKWKCARTKIQGGKCDSGPTADGQCGCPVEGCVPMRSTRTKRKKFVFACLSLAVGIVGLTLSSTWRNDVLAPGKLTRPHAQILRDRNLQRCATCHEQGAGGLSNWLMASVTQPTSPRASQSSLCMECHKSMIPPQYSGNAHSLDPDRLQALTRDVLRRQGADRRLAATTKQSACAACHQEHHGAEHDLKAMGNAQCAACHQDAFTSLASGHPDFGDWPNHTRGGIIFDHYVHEMRYFPERKETLTCVACHQLNDQGEPESTVSYEVGCARCHTKSVETSLQEPLALFRLPLLDARLLQENELEIGDWPAGHQGDFDGAIPDLMYLMLWADPQARINLEQFGPGFEFFDIDPDNFDDLEAVSELAWAIKRFLAELARDGRAAVRRRAEIIDGAHAVDSDYLDSLAAGLDVRAVQQFARDNFPNLSQEVADFLDSVETASRQMDTDAPNTLIGARWSMDEDGVVVTARGHGNGLVRAWIDLALQLGPSATSALPGLMGNSSSGLCLTCHSRQWQSNQYSLLANWESPSSAKGRAFTKFRHGPHLLQATLADCRSCHRANEIGDFAAGYEGFNPANGPHSFQPMTKSACASCHMEGGAGDSCLECHNYHIGP